MARYRKIDSRISNDETFRALSDDAKLVFILILVHPHMTSLGAMRGTVDGLAAELGWTERRYRKSFTEILEAGMIKYDAKASFIAATNFLKYNKPENPNVVKGWLSALDLLPECQERNLLIERAVQCLETLPEPFRKAFRNPFETVSEDQAQPFRIQEQEQEQEQKQEQKVRESGDVGSVQRGNGHGTRAHSFRDSPYFDSFALMEKLSDWPEERVMQYHEEMLSASDARGLNSLDWSATAINWYLRDMKEGKDGHKEKYPALLTPRIFAQSMNKLQAAFNFRLSSAAADVYYETLSVDYTDQQFEDVVTSLIRHGERFPTISRFYETKNNRHGKALPVL